MPTVSSGRVTVVSSAPDFKVFGPTDELTGFFADVTVRAGIRTVLPQIFTTIGRQGLTYVMTGHGCDHCGLGRRVGASRCDHPDLYFDEALIVDGRYAYTQGDDVFLRSLTEIGALLPDGQQQIIEEAYRDGNDLVRVWGSLPIKVGRGELEAVAVSVASAWGSEPIFDHQREAVGDWIGAVCAGAARRIGRTMDNIGTVAGEAPAPRPEVIWSC